MSRFNYIPVPPPSEESASRFWLKVRRGADDECWPYSGAATAGNYARFGVVLAHRFAYAAATGSIPDGMDILHSCDNPICCNPAHLSPGTHRQNMAEMAARGRRTSLTCERSSSAKVTRADVLSIRESYAAGGVTQRDLAAQFGMSQLNISRIVRGVTWKEAGGPLYIPRCIPRRRATLAARGGVTQEARR